MPLALIHDWLNQIGGAEDVLAADMIDLPIGTLTMDCTEQDPIAQVYERQNNMPKPEGPFRWAGSNWWV